MPWGRHNSLVTVAPLSGAALCLVALLVFSSAPWAQEPGKGTGAKTDPAKDPKADPAPAPDPLVEWKPGEKINWKQFKGGAPTDGFTAQINVGLYFQAHCNPRSLSVTAKMNPNDSPVDPDPQKQTAAALAHEQIHFDIAEKYARKLKQKLTEILDKECNCNITKEGAAQMQKDMDAAYAATMQEMNAEEDRYDDETTHGMQETDEQKAAQKKWADDVAKDLTPAPATPAATGTDKSADAGTGKPAVPGTGKPATPDKPAAPGAKKSAAKGAKKSNSGDSGFTPPPTDEVASAETVSDNACPPPRATYVPFPGTPGKGGQQYVSLIPGGGIPGYNTSYSVPLSSDSTTYCTFGEGAGIPGYLTAIDDNGNSFPPSSYDGGFGPQDGTPGGRGPQVPVNTPAMPVAVSGNPPPATTPKPVDKPTAPTDGPKTASTPTPTPTDTPVATTTDTPTPQTTTDDTPPIQITIFIKASETVLDGGQTGEPIQGQVVKLVMREKPGLPTTAENKTDTGYDKPAPQCTTGASGECKVDVPAEDRPLYSINQAPRIAGKPANNFRLAINLMKHTGGIAETTGKQVPDLKDSMTSGNVTAELVKIGSRTFVRLGFNTPYGATGDLVEQFSKLLGVPVEIDICLVKEPGPPLGAEQPASYEAINQELPRSVIRLRPVSRQATR